MRELPVSTDIRCAMVAARLHYEQEWEKESGRDYFGSIKGELGDIRRHWAACMRRDYKMYLKHMGWWIEDEELFTAFLLRFAGKYSDPKQL